MPRPSAGLKQHSVLMMQLLFKLGAERMKTGQLRSRTEDVAEWSLMLGF